jgi:hypothetical protein
VHPQRPGTVVFDADHVHVGQPDEQRAHARSVGLHRGSGGWTGVGTSDSGAPAPHPPNTQVSPLHHPQIRSAGIATGRMTLTPPPVEIGPGDAPPVQRAVFECGSCGREIPPRG